MRIEVRKLVLDNVELQNEIKKKLLTQLITINNNVKRNASLERKNHIELHMDLLYELYGKVINNLTGKELLDILTPMKSNWARKTVDQERVFNIIMSKLKNTDFNGGFEETYRDYLVNKYNEDKSLFIPKKYLEAEGAGKYYLDGTNISIEYGYDELNNKTDPEFVFNGQKGKYRTEYDAAETIIFNARDDLFGGSKNKIIIPYVHIDCHNMSDEERTLINIGFKTEDKIIKDKTKEDIDKEIKFIMLEIKEILKSIAQGIKFGYATDEEIYNTLEKLNKHKERIDYLRKHQELIFDSKQYLKK